MFSNLSLGVDHEALQLVSSNVFRKPFKRKNAVQTMNGFGAFLML